MENSKTTWIIVLLFVLFAIVFVPLRTLTGWNNEYGMMSSSYGIMGSGFGWIFMVVVLVALILLIVWLVQKIQNPQSGRRK